MELDILPEVNVCSGLGPAEENRLSARPVGNDLSNFSKTIAALKEISTSGLGVDVLRMLDAEIEPEILRHAARLYHPTKTNHRSRDFRGRFRMHVK